MVDGKSYLESVDEAVVLIVSPLLATVEPESQDEGESARGLIQIFLSIQCIYMFIHPDKTVVYTATSTLRSSGDKDPWGQVSSVATTCSVHYTLF